MILLSSKQGDSSLYPTMPHAKANWMNPTSEDKTETVTNVLLINYLYLLAELENAGKEAAGNRNVLIRYIQFLFWLISVVQTTIILALC